VLVKEGRPTLWTCGLNLRSVTAPSIAGHFFWNEAVDFFERYLGIGGRGDGSLEVLFLVVLGMIVLVTLSHFATR
jgi:hypothetical protein